MSFYTSLSGLRNAQSQLNVIAHNISNAETTGFKKGRAAFGDLVAGGTNTPPRFVRGIGSYIKAVKQDFGLGAMEQTGNATDFAINGDGFFKTVNGESGRAFYTRDGSYEIDGAGYLQDGEGNRLQMFQIDPLTGTVTNTTATVDVLIPAQNGTAPLAGVAVDYDGTISASYTDGTVVDIGRVALTTFLSPAGLRQVGSSAWEATGLSGPPEMGMPSVGQYGSILSSALERSNVDLAEEMVGLIAAQRYFQANAKAIDTASQLSQTIVNLRT